MSYTPGERNGKKKLGLRLKKAQNIVLTKICPPPPEGSKRGRHSKLLYGRGNTQNTPTDAVIIAEKESPSSWRFDCFLNAGNGRNLKDFLILRSDGRFVAACDFGGSVYVWNTDSKTITVGPNSIFFFGGGDTLHFVPFLFITFHLFINYYKN